MDLGSLRMTKLTVLGELVFSNLGQALLSDNVNKNLSFIRVFAEAKSINISR
jgi:hypothetical protein